MNVMGLLSVLWFNICALRAASVAVGILAGLAVIVLYPGLQHPESADTRIVTEHMPHALGPLESSLPVFMAAFMSTVATQSETGERPIWSPIFIVAS